MRGQRGGAAWQRRGRQWLCWWWCLVVWLAGCGAGEPTGFQKPNGVATAPDGSLYVMDAGNYRVVHVAADGQPLGAFGKLGTGPEEIFQGWDMALAPDGTIVICNQVSGDTGQASDGAKRFGPDGRLVQEIGVQQYTGDEEEVQNMPYGLDVDREGRVFIADYGASTVRVFDGQGELVVTLFGEAGSEDGQVSGPMDVAVDDERGLLYVSDFGNNRVQQFALGVGEDGTLTATHLLTIGGYGRGPGEFAYPQNLAVDDQSGRLYVSDVANRRVQEFDAEGSYLREYGRPGVADWQVLGLAVGGGRLYVADALNNKIWNFEPVGAVVSLGGS
jgi:DNA-binding beta-propeller fold protein YncE